MTEYIRYYHDGRTHLSLGKDMPAGRKAAQSATVNAQAFSIPRLGGLRHSY
jgi:hypothetical protein